MLRRAIQVFLAACCALNFIAPAPGRAAKPFFLEGFGSMAVDAANSQVFATGGTGTHQVAVYGFDGHLKKELGGFDGPFGVAVDGSDVYIANADGSTIDRYNTSTLQKVQTYNIGSISHPRDLVVLDGVVWYLTGVCGAGSATAIGYLVPETGESGTADDQGLDECGGITGTSAAPDTLFWWGNSRIRKYRATAPIISGVTKPTLELVASKDLPSDVGPAELVASPKGDRLLMVTGYSKTFPELDWDLNEVAGYENRPYGVVGAYSPDGTRLATAFGDSRTQINLYDQGTPAPEGHILLPRPIAYNGLQFSPDGSRLFVVTALYTTAGAGPPYHFDVLSSTKFSARLKLSTSREYVTYGQRIALTARLDSESRTREVRFYALSKGRELFVGKARLSDAGVARLKGLPTRNSTFIARWSGDDRYLPSRSNGVKVVVTVRILGKVFGGYGASGRYTLIHKGADAVYAAQVAPAHDHGKMYFTLQYNSGYGWQYAGDASVKVTKRGAGVGLRTLPAAAYRIWATFGDRDHGTGRTRVSYFKITG